MLSLHQNDQRYNYNISNPPIFLHIPLHRVVVDNLHMLLKVADMLIDMLIGTLRTLDRINQSLHIRSLDGLTHLAAYEAALKMIEISGLSFYIGKLKMALTYWSRENTFVYKAKFTQNFSRSEQ